MTSNSSGSESMDVDDAQTNTDSNELNVREPYVSLEFESVDEAYWFYNSYALTIGFGIKKGSTSKSVTSGDIIGRRFECNKSGFKPTKEGEGSSSRAHRLTRVNCKANLNIRKNKEQKWIVSGFVKEHNHELDTPSKAKRHRSHNILHKDKEVKKLMDQLYSAGMGPSRIAKILNETNSTSSISAKQVSMHLSEHRKNNIGNEGAAVYAYLKKHQELDPNFYFDIELDSNLVLCSFFWADSRSRNDFLTFGDVVVFDVTYKTNKFMMPFAPFTGVNHHRQSILFGCALLADETEETFYWLFNQWLKCMFDKAPTVIITDMDGAMYNAIKIVFPNTRHRFCSWHIGKHLIEHVFEIRDNQGDFKKDYYDWFNSKNVCTSEMKWKLFCQKYTIQSTAWLSKMWERRQHWVPAYLKDHFVAGMTSSGRSESINAYGAVMSTLTTLLENVRETFMSSQPSSIASQVGSTPILSSSYGISIRDPSIVKTKGRPKIASRIESGIETSQSLAKKRTCGTCGGKGHYSTTCPQKDKEDIVKKDHV